MFSEQDVDQELKAALSVSPSPDFEARILQRVGADRPSRWPAQYGWFAAAASLILVASVFYALNRTAPVVSEPRTPQVAQQPAPRGGFVGAVREPPASRPAVQKSPTQLPRVVAVRASRAATGSAPRTTEPVVLVPLNQMEAVRRLVRAVNEGRLEAPAEPAQGPMATPTELQVAPVEIKPIPLSPVAPQTETAGPFIRVLK